MELRDYMSSTKTQSPSARNAETLAYVSLVVGILGAVAFTLVALAMSLPGCFIAAAGSLISGILACVFWYMLSNALEERYAYSSTDLAIKQTELELSKMRTKAETEPAEKGE